jgi:3-dehydrosphinganine reductase
LDPSVSKWKEKIALIAGGSSGIGLATARQLVEAGAYVWILGRRQSLLDAAMSGDAGGRGRLCGAICADVSNWEQVQAAVEQVTAAASVPDLVVNSAGVTRPGYFQELNLEIFHELMEINYFGAVHLVKAVLPGMKSRRSGTIVNISSLAGHMGLMGYTAYSGSKFALAGFSDALRPELKAMGIQLSIVLPPDTDTPQLAYEKQYKPQEARELAGMAGVMQPEEVARILLEETAKGRYLILPGLESKFWYRAISLGEGLGLLYPILDWLIGRAQKEHKAW